MSPYENRSSVGRQLAQALHRHADSGALVLAIPRGGVAVATQIAARLSAELDVILVYELPFAICVEGARPVVDLERVIELGLHAREVTAALEGVAKSIEQHREWFCGRSAPARIAGRTVIVVDDGSSSLGMLLATISALNARGARPIVIATPLIHPDDYAALRARCDEVVGAIDARRPECVIRDFSPVGDDEVIVHLHRYHEAGLRSS
jgi:putative phosphoribosyl transferase